MTGIRSYPDGRVGLGLLVLRLAIGGALVLGGTVLVAAGAVGSSIGWLAIATGALLAVGFWTSASGAVAAVATATLLAWAPGASAVVGGPIAAGLTAAGATALALVGPGALSLEARRFGRREIIIERPARNP